MVKPRTNQKSVAILPEAKNSEINMAATIAIVATIPDIALTTIGVPYLPLKRPSATGAVRSRAAIAYVRSAPIIHVPPLEARAITTPRAIKSAQTSSDRARQYTSYHLEGFEKTTCIGELALGEREENDSDRNSIGNHGDDTSTNQ